ncbi:MAG: isoleucine--tRNA ligase [Erysipelotrichaceae bacterium]
MDYKNSLWMPDTAFEMRGNLTKKEPALQQRWETMKLYEKMLAKRDGAPTFVLHDGPPYANGNIHIGHALNKTLKDMVVRSRFMMGYQTPFVPGWDTHGLPIESAMQKLGYNRKEMSVADFRKLCNEYALEQVAKQMKDMKSLGTVADYDHPYITLQKDFEAKQIQIFAKMAMAGMIYKGLKPVYWSPSSESALAEAEIEYHDKKDPTIFVAFDVVDGKGILTNKERFVIWTTTPWTLPANLAICLNPKLEYAVVESDKGNFVYLKSSAEALAEKFKFNEWHIAKTYKGYELEGILTEHPFYQRTSVVILGDHVEEEGTGCVHTAPGHGVDDFIVGQKYGLEAFCPVDGHGKMTIEAGEFLVGQYVDVANTTIIKKLEELGALMAMEWITHSYPHDWRTKKPVIFRATTQWFASIAMIRKELLEQIDSVNWIPKWGQLRMHNMIKDRGDWCISRQRVWGVPIPIFYSEDGNPILDAEVFEHISKLFGEHGSNIWFLREAKELLPAGFTHPASPNGIFTKETDIMDVWFDSGSSHNAVITQRGGTLPVDLYLEGSDQYRGWFNSSLIVSTAVNGFAPYKTVLSHGFALDGKGEKMSKSLGNSVEPNKVVQSSGADIIRLWASSIAYQSDVRISDELLKQVMENYRKIRNTFRFMLGNINPADFSEKDLLDVNTLADADRHVLSLLNEVVRATLDAYETYDFMSVVSTTSNFLTNTMSAYYLDFTKDILYIEKKDALRRRQVQTVLYHTVSALTRLLAPVLVHTCEEVWDHFVPGSESVHLTEFPKVLELNDEESLKEEFARLFDLRTVIFKALEEARNVKTIGKSLEAAIHVRLNNSLALLVQKHLGASFAQWCIVSLAEVEASDEEETLVDVRFAPGVTCPRCWNVTEHGAQDGLCPRCQAVLKD